MFLSARYFLVKVCSPACPTPPKRVLSPLYAPSKNQASGSSIARWKPNTSAALAPKVDVLITVVVNADQTETVLFGENGAVPHMKPGAVVIASATVSPEFAKALGKRLTEAGLLMIDGPISGGAAKAMAGEMTVMSSGSPEAYAKCEDVLDAIAGKVYRLGDEVGPGSVVKMVNQHSKTCVIQILFNKRFTEQWKRT